MLEEYLQVQGREWERFAWLKSRVVAPQASVAAGRVAPLRSLVTAFVYRRYLDYGVFEGLRQLHRKIREEAQRRAAGRPERANDVKLSRGGIREIEFIVQLMLVVRGGQFPEIRTRSTLRSLQRLGIGLARADEDGLFAPVQSAILTKNIPVQYRAKAGPDGSTWFGFSTRARVIVYNKIKVKRGDVDTYLKLADPMHKGQLCTRSGSHPYNLSLFSMMAEHIGA